MIRTAGAVSSPSPLYSDGGVHWREMDLFNVVPGTRGRTEHLAALETGNILYFGQSPFEIPDEDREALLGAGQADGDFHKNIAYRPASEKLTGLGKARPGEADRIRHAVATYSRQAIQVLETVLPSYKKGWRTDYASFRSIEEEGRSLPTKKRNDLLHTDAFPTRPTNGDLILRIFTNLNPSRERVWQTSDPFDRLAPQLAVAAGLSVIAGRAHSPAGRLKQIALRTGRAAGLPLVQRSPYDEFMLRFHDFLKFNESYQRNSVKYRFAFPPGSSWIVFTDVVPHAVLSGRYALEQTMLIARQSLNDPQRSPASILERLSGLNLTFS